MISHPDYVQKITDKQILEHYENVRYIYPLPNGTTQNSSFRWGFETDEGFTSFEFHFDHTPKKPTCADIITAIPKCCSTCVNQGMYDCPYFRKKHKAKVCCDWEWDPAPRWGEVLYYANLHKAAYEEKFKAAAGVE